MSQTAQETARIPFIAGNWKLHHGVDAAVELATGVVERWEALGRERSGEVEVCMAPVATALYPVAQAVADSDVALAGQNCWKDASGAFTGELSPALLKDAGASHCIIGHSERRTLFGETDSGVRAKLAALLEAGVAPILCVGETLEQREAGETDAVVCGQLDAALSGIAADTLGPLIVAYEPVWAIGTGRTASPADAQAVHAALRARLEETHGEAVAAATRILYGGSVKPANAAELLAQPDIDGALVGGASLKVDSFAGIIEAAYG